jgi:hypothetical protein
VVALKQVQGCSRATTMSASHDILLVNFGKSPYS